MSDVLPQPVVQSRYRRWMPEIGILVLALLLRLVALELKPPHFDEGTDGFFVDSMIQSGYYSYDPTNFHGPLHFYVLFLFQTLFGRHIWALRLPIALFSSGCVALALAYRRFLRPTTCRLAALALALSPAMTFYGRYAIHESFLLLSLMTCVWGVLGLWRDGERRDLWAAGLGLAGMILTKETYAIHAAAMLLAWPTLLLLEHFSPSLAEPRAARQWGEGDVKAMLAVALGAIVFFYSGGFLNWGSVPGLWTTFLTWSKTGTEVDGGHAKVWCYWLDLLRQHELPAVAGLIFAAWIVRPGQSRALRYLAIMGGGTLVAYSIIRYKTPWCLIVIMWPFLFVFGWLGELVLQRRQRVWRLAGMLALVAALAHSAYVALRLNFFHYADEKEPYVYVQTTRDLDKIMRPLQAKIAADPVNYQLRGLILFEQLGDGHPLPWLLGDFPHVAFLSQVSSPGTSVETNADFLLIQDSYVGDIEDRLNEDYFRETLTLRGNSGVECYLYWKASVFASLFPGRTPEFHPLISSPTPDADEAEMPSP